MHSPNDRSDTLGNGLQIAVPPQGLEVPPVRLFQNPDDLFFGESFSLLTEFSSVLFTGELTLEVDRFMGGQL